MYGAGAKSEDERWWGWRSGLVSPTPYLNDNSLAFPGRRGPESPGEEGLQRAQGGHHPSGEFSLRGTGSGEWKSSPRPYQPCLCCPQTLFNPNQTVVKMFLVTFDFSDMPAAHMTFLRHRLFLVPVGEEGNAGPTGRLLCYLLHLR